MDDRTIEEKEGAIGEGESGSGDKVEKKRMIVVSIAVTL